MSEVPVGKSGSTPFKPRARLVSVLGEQLIRDATVGIIELVKNGYDADADFVRVELHNLAQPDRTTIVVRDNGFGMTLETVLDKWFEPASGHKEAQKKAEQRTPRGRLPLGEKGVGRFAAQKLGKELKMVTRAEGEEEEVAVEIDWTGFELEGAYLESVPMRWHLRTPETFPGNQTGTRLEMMGARSKWTESDVSKVARNLKRLMSPFRTPNAFRVQFKCREFPKYEDLDPGDLLEQAHATFIAVVDDNGKIDYDYKFKLPGYEKRESYLKSDDLGSDLRTINKQQWNDPTRLPSCGPFFLNFYLWDRRPDSLRLTGTKPDDLNESTGVSIFRDGIRVLPYGDPNDDWLELDKQRYMKSSKAISRKNIVGAVEITQTLNKGLKDKTNREGLMENEAYADFIALLKGAIQKAQNEFSEDRAKLETSKKAPSAKLLPSFEQLDASISALAELSQPLEEAALALSAALKAGKPIGQVEVDRLTDFVRKTTKALSVVRSAQKVAERAVEDSIEEFTSERDVLLNLSGLGLAAERFTHEFSRLTREADETLQRIRARLVEREPQAADDIDSLGAVIDALKNDIRALGPLFYVRRAARDKNLDLKKVISNALMLNDSQIKDNEIEVEVVEKSPLKIFTREGPITQVFNNLFDNACYWLSRESKQDNRKLRVVINGIERTVLVSNNGPAISPKVRHRIFEPFFTEKADGRGLGLYITKEILEEMKTVIVLVDDGKGNMFEKGVSFLIRFPPQEEVSGGNGS
jgi:signal transduction histidine kinase